MSISLDGALSVNGGVSIDEGGVSSLFQTILATRPEYFYPLWESSDIEPSATVNDRANAHGINGQTAPFVRDSVGAVSFDNEVPMALEPSWVAPIFNDVGYLGNSSDNWGTITEGTFITFFKPPSVDANRLALAFMGDEDDNTNSRIEFHFRNTECRLQADAAGGTSTMSIDLTVPPTQDKWNMLAWIHDNGSTFNAFLNGTYYLQSGPDITKTGAGVIWFDTLSVVNTIALGARPAGVSGSSNRFDGHMIGPVITQAQWTEEELVNLYNIAKANGMDLA